MSSLILNSRVIARGKIVEFDDHFVVNDNLFFKTVFGAAQVVDAEPSNEGEWLYVNGTFIPYVEQQLKPQEYITNITARQARLALLNIGLLDQVESAFANLPDTQRKQAYIEWEYASNIDRNSPLVQQFGVMLGLSDVQIDNLFIDPSFRNNCFYAF